MNENEKHLWLASCELGDYFSRLGGSARYFNMSESEISLYIGCRLAERYFPSFDKKDYLDSCFLEAAKPVLEKADKQIEAVSANNESIIQIIREFVQYADSKLKADKSNRWLEFVKWIENVDV